VAHEAFGIKTSTRTIRRSESSADTRTSGVTVAFLQAAPSLSVRRMRACRPRTSLGGVASRSSRASAIGRGCMRGSRCGPRGHLGAPTGTISSATQSLTTSQPCDTMGDRKNGDRCKNAGRRGTLWMTTRSRCAAGKRKARKRLEEASDPVPHMSAGDYSVCSSLTDGDIKAARRSGH
jgi:hypothetical protein